MLLEQVLLDLLGVGLLLLLEELRELHVHELGGVDGLLDDGVGCVKELLFWYWLLNSCFFWKVFLSSWMYLSCTERLFWYSRT